jgi:DNA-binding MarR family transcriptional regulator
MASTPHTQEPPDSDRDELIARVMAFERTFQDTRLPETVDALLAVPLTIRQLKVLGVIMAGGGTVTSQHIATAFHISLATVSGLVDRLVESGMVVRVANPADQRSHTLSPTDAGTAMMRNLMASTRRMRRDALSALEIDDLAALAQGLDALGRALSSAGQDPQNSQ